MAQYHLRSLPSRDYAAMHAGDELDENEEFHDSFDFPQETAPPGTSTGNPSGQFSTPLAQNRGPNGSQDEIAELTAALAQAKVENDELERRAEVTKLKAELHALHKRNAHLQSQTARVEAVSTVPTGRAVAREPSMTINQLRAQFAWPAVREFHAAVLFEIECGRARWGASFAHLESRLLRATGKPVSNPSPSRQSTAVLFCRNFQTGKCTHSKDHYFVQYFVPTHPSLWRAERLLSFIFRFFPLLLWRS